MARVAAVCGVSPDSDLLWTFLAGCVQHPVPCVVSLARLFVKDVALP